MTSLRPQAVASRAYGGTCLFGRIKIWVFKYEEVRNQENHSSEDRRSEDGQFENLKIPKSED